MTAAPNRAARRRAARARTFPFVLYGTATPTGWTEPVRLYQGVITEMDACAAWVNARKRPLVACPVIHDTLQSALRVALDALARALPPLAEMRLMPWQDAAGVVWVVLAPPGYPEPRLLRVCSAATALALGLVPCGACSACRPGTAEAPS